MAEKSHLQIVHRKQQSESPFHQPRILARLVNEAPQRIHLPQNQKSLYSILRTSSQTKLSIRQKSANFQGFEELVNYRKLVKFIRYWKNQSDFDLLGLNDIVVCYGAELDENTPGLLLETCVKLRQLILEFVDYSSNQLIAEGFQACKTILVTFENIKTEYNTQAANLDRQSLSVLNFLISQIRFVLSRFGRTVTIYEVIAAKYKLSHRGSDFLSNQQTSTSQSKKQSDSLNRKRTIVATDISRDTSLPLVLLSSEEKADVVIKQQFQLQRAVWREQYDLEKAQSVPTIVCRVCGLKFYADQSKKHSTFCIQKTEKLKEQRKLDQQFLQMSSKSTETMLFVQHENAKNQNIATLLQTPTLQRRSFMAPKHNQVQQNNQQQSQGVKAINVLAQYAVGAIPTRQNQDAQKTKESQQAELKTFQSILNLKDGNGNPLMTPQPSKAGFKQEQTSQPKVANNYFNALTQIRRDVPLATVVEEKPKTANGENFKQQNMTPNTNASALQTQDQTPKLSVKAALESLFNQKLPKSPYLEAYQSRYKNTIVSEGTSMIFSSDPSSSSIKQGRRTDYWRRIQNQLNQSVKNDTKDQVKQIQRNFEILNRSGGHMSLLDKRLNSLVAAKQTKKQEDLFIKIDASKYASAFQDKNSFISVCASPLITSRGAFSQQHQKNKVPDQLGAKVFKDQSLNSTLGSFSNNQMVCSTPMISSMNNRLQGKQDLESLEVVKVLSNDAFNIAINAEPISFQQQTEIFKTQSQKIAQMLTATNLNSKTVELMSQYKELVNSKLESLYELIKIDRSYLTTLPGSIQKQRQKEDQLNESKVKKLIDQMNPQQVQQKKTTAVRRKESVKAMQLHKSETIKASSQRNDSNDLSPTSKPEQKSLQEQSIPANRIGKPPTQTKSKFAGQQARELKEESFEKEMKKLAEISDLSDEDHICSFQTLTKAQPSFNVSFLFQRQLEETIPRPAKQSALRYVSVPQFADNDFSQVDFKPVNFVQPPVVKRKIDRRRIRAFRLDGESDLDSFSSDSFKSCRSQNSPAIIFKLRSKSDIVIGTHIFQAKENTSDWEKQSEFLDMVYVSNLANKTNQLSPRQAKTKQKEVILSISMSDQEDSISSDGMEILQIDQVRFNSCSILPSHLESCRLERQNVSNQCVQITDFSLLKTLSWGAYGRVVLSRKKDTKDLFAIKVMDKAAMVHLNVAEFVMNERNILNQIDCDYIVRGMYTFQTPKYLYMVMEYMRGGDFGNLLEKCGFFNLETSRFYLAHIVAGLEHLHSKGIVHRDLKPENMLIGADGHIKLTDFGLSDAGLKNTLKDVPSAEEESKSVASSQAKQQKKYRIVGTADYMAPEVILGHDVSTLMDFWSLGIIAYEFLTGELPFNCDTQDQIFKNVLYKPIELPPEGLEEDQMHPDARDFLDKLLQRDPKKRLGAKNGIKDIKEHVFFQGINWKQLMREPAPWIPPAAKDLDMTNFPKAQQKEDSELKKLIEEEGLDSDQTAPSTPKLNVREFNQFNGVSYSALQNINEAESQKALKWMQRQQKKVQQNGQGLKELTRFQDKDLTIKVSQTKTHLRSISAERKKVIRPF